MVPVRPAGTFNIYSAESELQFVQQNLENPTCKLKILDERVHE